MNGFSLHTLAAESLLDHVVAQPIELFGLHITNHKLMLAVGSLVMLIVFLRAGSRIARGEFFTTRGRLSQVIEVILLYLRDEMARPALGALTDKYIGFIWTTFFFILTGNLLGMIPWSNGLHVIYLFAGSDPHHARHWDHWQGTFTGNISVTAALAIVSFFMMHYVGVKQNGVRYFAHFAPMPFTASPMSIVSLLLVFLEIIGAFIKPFALAMRLFANMIAGHMVLAALIGLIFLAAEGLGAAAAYGIAIPVIGGSIAMSCLELFVAFLQAYIFTFLTVLFIAQGAVHEHHDDHGHDHDHDHAHGAAH